MNRKCAPVDCDAPIVREYLERVIEFYEAVIKKTARMTAKELNTEEAFKFLVKIDEKVAKKYEK